MLETLKIVDYANNSKELKYDNSEQKTSQDITSNDVKNSSLLNDNNSDIISHETLRKNYETEKVEPIKKKELKWINIIFITFLHIMAVYSFITFPYSKHKKTALWSK